MTDEELLKEARERRRHCVDTQEDSRKKQLFDLKFATLDQWDAGIRQAREDTNQPGGARPCLTIDKIGQYVAQVVNDMRQNRPSIKVRPVDDSADPGTAEVLQDLARHIEEQSTAQVAYITAGQSQVITGEGYCRVLTEFQDPATWQQKIVIKPIPDMFTVHLGPHIMPDGSDAEYGFIAEEIPKDRFRRDFPDAKWEKKDFDGLGEAQKYWESEDSIWVVEYFYFEYEAVELLQLADGETLSRADYDTIPENIPKPAVLQSREAKRRKTKWCKLTGVEVLKKEDWAGKYIPIAKAIGKEAWVDGKHLVWGIVRSAIDSLRAYNYTFSAITEKLALAPKAPFIGAVGQFETAGDKWDKANQIAYSRLEYDAVEVNGQLAPPPRRQEPTQLETALIQHLQLIEHDIQTSLGMFKASVGQEQPQQSGKAILALNRESDTSTFNFPDGLALMVRHVGRIVVDLIPKIYDTKQIVRLLGEDGEHRSAEVDPEQPVAKRQVQQAGKIKSIYNLGIGTYDVTVTTGPSFNTRRMEAASVFTDLANTAKDPASAAVMRYLAIKNSDFNGVDKAVDMLKKLLPPNLQESDDAQPELPPQVVAKFQEMQMQGQQMQMLIQKMDEEITKLKAGEEQAQAKIAADHDAAMKELQLKERVEAEELRIAEEKTQREVALKAWVAEQELAIKDKTANREHALEANNQAFEQWMQKLEFKVDQVQNTLGQYEVQK